MGYYGARAAARLVKELGIPLIAVVIVTVLIVLVYCVCKLYKCNDDNNDPLPRVQRDSSNLKPDNEFRKWLRSRRAFDDDPPRVQEHDSVNQMPDPILLSVLENRSWKPRSAAETPMLVKDTDSCLNGNTDSLGVLEYRSWEPRSAAETPMLGKEHGESSVHRNEEALGVNQHRF